MEVPLQENLTLGYDNFMKMTHEQKLTAFGAIFKLNDIIAEINDEDKTLHIHNVPPHLVPAINKYNRHHTGPDSNQINITQICVDALTNALSMAHVVWDEPADEMVDNPEDINGKELNVGDRVIFTVTGTDKIYELEGKVTLEGETYCIDTGDNLFILDDDILELKLLEVDE